MNDNAAIRLNYVGELYQAGVNEEKKKILYVVGQEFYKLHEEGVLHIHDLEAYGKVYNCCTPDLACYLRSKEYNSISQQGKLFELFEHIKNLIIELATNQSGGIGFANFDRDIAELIEFLHIDACVENYAVLRDCIADFIKWINITYTRYCREPYYLTLNIGLSDSEWSRKVAYLLLEIFENSPIDYKRPNIVYKVNCKINGIGTENYDIYKKALECTAKRMIPTYLLTNSDANSECDPFKLAIMGCRTRVYDNVNGAVGAVSRGNIACVSINLPLIALEYTELGDFYENLDDRIDTTVRILRHRTELLMETGEQYLKFILDNRIWNTNELAEILRQGTLSVGFIGLSECVEILTGCKPFQDSDSFELSVEIIRHMRKRMNYHRTETGMNFSLIASAGEMLSNKFCELDHKKYPHPTQDKGFYTNSFHVNVDAGVSIYEKIDLEAPFHKLCNGGCITYIELSAAPLTNIEALNDGIMYAQSKGISYLGYNFPYDICNTCGNFGTFDVCERCGSADIKRIRRVSGYLEEVPYFTKGKQMETEKREANLYVDVK